MILLPFFLLCSVLVTANTLLGDDTRNSSSNGNDGNVEGIINFDNPDKKNDGFLKPSSDLLGAIGRSLRKVLKKFTRGLKKFTCETVCPLLCTDLFGEYVCLFRCDPLCNRNKRSVKETGSNGHITPLPNSFSSYDLNDDDVVSLKELSLAAGHNVTQDDLIMVFEMADTNDDKTLTAKELYEGPFVFEMDIDGSDSLFCKYEEYRTNRKSQPTTIPSEDLQ